MLEGSFSQQITDPQSMVCIHVCIPDKKKCDEKICPFLHQEYAGGAECERGDF